MEESAETLYNVVLLGMALPGFETPEAAAALGPLIKRDRRATERLFQGTPSLLSTGADAGAALRTVHDLAGIGVAAKVELAGAVDDLVTVEDVAGSQSVDPSISLINIEMPSDLAQQIEARAAQDRAEEAESINASELPAPDTMAHAAGRRAWVIRHRRILSVALLAAATGVTGTLAIVWGFDQLVERMNDGVHAALNKAVKPLAPIPLSKMAPAQIAIVAARGAKAAMPLTIDDDTRVEEVTAGPGAQLNFLVRLRQHTAGSFDAAAMEEKVRRHVCSQHAHNLLDEHVALRYRYKDFEEVPVIEFTVSEETCRSLDERTRMLIPVVPLAADERPVMRLLKVEPPPALDPAPPVVARPVPRPAPVESSGKSIEQQTKEFLRSLQPMPTR